MIESYEPTAEVRLVSLDEIEHRLRRLGEEWDRHGEELCRLHPEIETAERRGPVATPWTIQRQ